MSQLFDGNGSDSDLDLKTNTDFAKHYDTWRQKEELHKLQTKYGNVSSDSSSSSEDDEGEEINEKFDKDFLKTLSCLKSKDPRIYDKNFEFFDSNEVNDSPTSSTNKKKKEKPVYLKDFERNIILERGGQLSDDEENQEPRSSTYVEEQIKLKEGLKNALSKIDDDQNEDSELGGMLKKRQKTNEEKIKELQDYLQWLAGQIEHLNDESVENDLKALKDFWTNPNLDEAEKFIRDYLLKRRFLDNEDPDHIPTYKEVVHDSDEDLSEDEKALSTQEEFEHKYNFRFEEPDQEFIKRYPRTVENSLRQQDDKRKIKRSERKQRKALEKQQKMEEIKQLKALKEKEIEEKIAKLKEITGNTEVGFDVKDLEDDFDPEKHDKLMKNWFSDEYYEGPEGEQKPEFPEIDKELELENWDYWHGTEGNENGDNEYKPHCEDEDFNMDCDYDPASTQKELIENSKKKKKHRRKSKFATALSQSKPVFDPNDKTYQQYLDEYYKLDCEDIIGDIPCRFKYREVVPNSFGLSIEEILTAKDKELNRWCSLKKTIQHRPDHVEKYDVIAFERKAKNIDLKKKCLPSLFVEEKVDNTFPSTSSNVDNEKNAFKNKGNKKSKSNTTHNNDVHSSTNKICDEPVEEKDQKAEENSSKVDEVKAEDDNKLLTIDNKKNKMKKHKLVQSKNNNDGDVGSNILSGDSKSLTSNSKKNKKRKHKLSQSQNNNDDDVGSNTVSKNKRKRDSFNKNKQNNKKAVQDIGISDARLTAYGINPKKFKNKLKYGNN